MNDQKPRSDSKLKTLPEERQEEIYQYLNSHSLEECVEWLGKQELTMSASTLSRFRSCFAWRLQADRNQDTKELMLEKSAEKQDLTLEKRNEIGHDFFTEMALQQQDTKGWVKLQQVELKRDRLVLDRQRFRRQTCELFIQWYKDQRASEVLEGEWSNAEKIEQLGVLMFGEDWRGTSVTLDPKAPAAEGSKTPS